MADCKYCGGVVDDFIVNEVERLAKKLGKDIPQPKMCSACLWQKMVDLVNEPDEEDGSDEELS